MLYRLRILSTDQRNAGDALVIILGGEVSGYKEYYEGDSLRMYSSIWRSLVDRSIIRFKKNCNLWEQSRGY
jgi:hypothetical protein